MTTNTTKSIAAGIWGALLLAVARAFGQTNLPASVPLPDDTQANIIWAMWNQVARDPACMVVIVFLCVMGWLADDLPFIPSRYVPHITVMIGAAIYGLFSQPASVPKNFPHPWAVFIVNGTICGFIAFLCHRQLVARVIAFIRNRDPAPTPTNNPLKGNP